MSYSVGAGLLKRMGQMKTTPASDEIYVKNSDGSTAWSEAMGMDARIYRYLPATGQVLYFDPLSWVPVGSGDDPAAPVPPITQVFSPNRWPTRDGHTPIALVIHTMAGSLAGSDAWFANPASQVSAHYGIGLSGEAHQYVPLEGSAWANGVLETGNTWPGPAGVNCNLLTVSAETEDLGNPNQKVTSAQYDSTVAVGRLALARYPSIVWLLRHADISPRSRANCPGQRWVGSGAFASLAQELKLKTRL